MNCQICGRDVHKVKSQLGPVHPLMPIGVIIWRGKGLICHECGPEFLENANWYAIRHDTEGPPDSDVHDPLEDPESTFQSAHEDILEEAHEKLLAADDAESARDHEIVRDLQERMLKVFKVEV